MQLNANEKHVVIRKFFPTLRGHLLEGDDLADGLPTRADQLVHEVGVVPHADGAGKTDASGARHVR